MSKIPIIIIRLKIINFTKPFIKRITIAKIIEITNQTIAELPKKFCNLSKESLAKNCSQEGTRFSKISELTAVKPSLGLYNFCSG